MSNSKPKCEIYIGIDVSKKNLDVYILEHDKHFQFSQTETGLSELVEIIGSFNPALVVLEATGGFENNGASILASSNIPVAVVNPRQVRDFAKATGTLAKTDCLDAKIIAMFGKAIKPNISALPDETLKHINLLVRRRAQLVSILGQEKNRFSSANGFMAKSIKKHIAWLKKELEQLDKNINDFIKSSPIYKEKVQIFKSTPGCGPVLASSLIAFMPELGKLDRKKIALLAGLAPLNNDSGKFKGKRTIRGGRENIRSILYMPTMAAIRFNPAIKEFYERLLSKGKPKKVAITACMRKLLVTLNAMCKTKTEWSFKEQLIRA